MQNLTEIGQSAYKKIIFNMAVVCYLEFKKAVIFIARQHTDARY